MSKLWKAIASGLRRFCPKNENPSGQVPENAEKGREYRTKNNNYYDWGFSNLSPIEEARLRHCAFWELRQW